MKSLLEKMGKHLIMVIFTAISIYLLTMNVISTCYADRNEHAYYVFDSILPTLIALTLIFLFYYLNKTGKINVTFRFNLKRFLIGTFIVGCIYIFGLRIQPNADQRVCLDIAKQMHLGNFAEFGANGYMQAYPQQVGLVLYFYFLGFIIGHRNVLVLQIINVAAYTAFLYCIYHIALRLWKKESIAQWTCILMTCFIPLIMLTTFIYGTMIGLAASTYALLKAMDYMEDHSLRSGLTAALFGAISMLFKKNYLIVILAIAMMLFVHAICKKHYKAFLVIIVMFFCSFSFGKVATITMEGITNIKMDDGMPSIAWMTMGLQEGPRANGWYNEYSVKVYMDHNNDTAATAEQCKEDLITRLKELNADKLGAMNFFNQKLASEWAEPTFQCFHLVHNQTKVGTYTEAPRTFANRIIAYALVPYLNILASILFLGIAMYAIFDYRKVTLWQLLPVVVFIGGFIFHTIWEAKGQYTICYFVLLFPYCAKGYYEAFKKFDSLIDHAKDPSFAFNAGSCKQVFAGLRPFYLVAVITILFYSVVMINPIANYTVSNSNQKYYAYAGSDPINYQSIQGCYRVVSLDGKYYMDMKQDPDTGNYVLYLNDTIDDSQVIEVTNLSKQLVINFVKYNVNIASATNPKIDAETVKYYRNYYADVLKWSVSQNDDNTFSIKTPDNFALTRRPDNTLVWEVSEKDAVDQKWNISKVVE